MLTYNAERLIRLHDQRWGALGSWRNQWARMAQYIMPSSLSGLNVTLSPGTNTAAEIYDSTALEANDKLSNRMHEALTNPQTEWFHLKFKDNDVDEDDEAREWLDDCEDKLRSAIADSNFNIVMGQFYLDLGCFATAPIDMGEKDVKYSDDEDSDTFRGFLFRSLSLGAVSFGQSAEGIIDQVFVKFDYTAEQWVRRFGDECPQEIRDKAKENPDENFPLLVCRFERDPMDPKTGKRKAKPEGNLMAAERPWAEVWVDYTHKRIVEDGGTYERASFVGRWRTRTGDIMGYGPGERALPTILSLNEAERLELKAWAKQIDPPIKTKANNIVGNAEIKSGGITVVRDMENSGTWDLRPDLNHHMIQTEDKRFQIREIFKQHSLELPPREAVGEMTAFEIAKRIEQIYRSLGPTLVQLIPDVLNGIVERGFGIMYRRGALLPPPQIVLEAGKLDIEYLGPLALAQRATEIEAIDAFIGDALALKNAEVEEAMDLVDMNAALRYKAKLRGVPAKVQRSKEQVKAIQEARSKAKAQAVAEQSAMNAGAAAKDLAAAENQVGQAGNDVQQQGAILRMVPGAR